MSFPTYLRGYEKHYETNPRQAVRDWFKGARYGLFIHYGLYSLLERHEWVQLHERIPVAEYEKLAASFTAENFNAREIAQFACDAGMKYITFTTRHHDSFCLFDTKETDFNSLNSPCGRDLIAELSRACAEFKLGLCLYYSHGRDWRHPHAPNNDTWGGCARPEYAPPEPSYAYGEKHDLHIYLEFMTRQITELLTQYSPITSIWLDGIGVPLRGNTDAFHCQELYDHIHRLQPHVLVAYKQGITGTEDYFAPEHNIPTATVDTVQKGKITETTDKIIEVCTTMCPGSWGYHKAKAGTHLSEEAVWEKLTDAGNKGYNLLLNTGPLPDGSLDQEDVDVLLRIGEQIRTDGYP